MGVCGTGTYEVARRALGKCAHPRGAAGLNAAIDHHPSEAFYQRDGTRMFLEIQDFDKM